MSDNMQVIMDKIDSQTFLDALQGFLREKTPESKIAIEKIGKIFEKAGVDCGPNTTRIGFIQRQLMNYAGEQMVRELHQKVSNK